MGEAIKPCAANLANFDGRDARSTFWWWVLLVVIVAFVISFVTSVVFVASAMTGAFQSAAGGVDEAQLQIEMMQATAEGMETQFWIGSLISIVGLGLVIATFVRRLRDAGLPVLIAIVPVVTMLWSLYAGYGQISEISELMAAGDIFAVEDFAASAAATSLIGYVGYLVVIVCGLIPTKAN